MIGISAETASLRKAAIVLATLGEDLAARVCLDLPADQTRLLQDELAHLEDVPAYELNSVLDEFLTLATAPPVADPSVSEDALEDLRFFTRLNDLQPAVLWRALHEEGPVIAAAVLSHLTPTQAGLLLSFYSDAEAADIAYRAAHLGSPSPGALEALAAGLRSNLGGLQNRTGGTAELSLQFVADLIGSMPGNQGKAILQAMQHVDKKFGDGVAEQVITFDDISKLADQDLQRMLRAVDLSVVVLALKGTSAEIRERIKQNLSQRGRERLDEEMEMLGRVPLSQVQDAQKQVCQQLRALAEADEIRLDSGDVEYVE